MSVSGPLAALDAAIESAAPAERAALVVQLAARLAALGAGLTTVSHPAPRTMPDENLDVKTGARRLGMSRTYIYRNAKKLPFVVRIGRRLLLSSRGIDRYLEAGGRR